MESQVANCRRFYDRNYVSVYGSSAWFLDENTVEVRTQSGEPRRITGEQIIIATGSRPCHPPELDFSHPRVRDSDSDSVLRYDASPFAVTLFGAGTIGCEIAEALSYHLHEQGGVIRHNDEFAALEPRASDVVLHLQSGRKFKSDLLLWTNGRTGNSDGMNLEAIGLAGN